MGDISVNSYFLLNLFIFIQICTLIDLGHGFKKANTLIFLSFEKNRYVFLFDPSIDTVVLKIYSPQHNISRNTAWQIHCQNFSLLPCEFFVNKFIRNVFSCPRGVGTFCYFLQNICPRSGTFVTFCRLLKTNPHLYPGVEGVRVYFDWCIALCIISFICMYLIYCPGPSCSKADNR